MNGIKGRIIYGLLPMIMIPLVSCLLQSCFSEDCPTTDETGIVSVQLQIKTNGISDLNATRADITSVGTDSGENGEFMNTLCVFIVDANTGEIELKLQPDLSGTEADSGDLEKYTSDILQLTIGAKTIYAFANWDNTKSKEWSTLINKEEGETINASELSFTIADPASKVDIEKEKYIPMSGKEDVTIREGDLNSKNIISVGLDRLVGKVTVSVVGDREFDATVDSLFFEGTADNVTLFPKETGDSWNDITFGEAEKNIDSGDGITLSATKVDKNSIGQTIATFYINESYRSKSSDTDGLGYTINLDMKRDSTYYKYDGTKYVAMTTRQDVPRNYIYPIRLQLDTYDVEFNIVAKTAPIGYESETEYTTNAEFHEEGDGYYQITLRDITSSFTVTPILYEINGKDWVEVTEDVKWEWDYTGSDLELQQTDSGDGIINVTGLTAIDHAYNFTLTVSWTTTDDDSGITISHNRTYNVQVVLEEGDFEIVDGDSYNLAPAPWKSLVTPYERLNLTLKKNVE